MSFYAGFNVKCRVNGAVYTVKRVSLRETSPDLDVSNSEGKTGGAAGRVVVGTRAVISGNDKTVITLTNPTWDDAENPFLAGRSVSIGHYASIQVYPVGLTGVHWNYPSALCIDVGIEGDVDGLIPPSCTFTSDGGFDEPTT